ncbi:MAG TPA: type VI secretion system contractile sheath large subunit, partial [Pirellulaceae bacterium]|nr:type VI secretion system contractile sheath large subunit [Pirellulaceae bacterium]
MSTDRQSSAAQGQVVTATGDEFSSLLQREFKPKSDEAKSAIAAAVQTLAEQALERTDLVSDDALRSITALIAALDKKLTEQVNEILHHADFQKVESAWRGLHYLVNNTET